MTAHLSDFALDALDAGAATALEKASAEAHLGECAHCRERLAGIASGFPAEVDERALLAKLRTRADAQETAGFGARIRRFFAPFALVTVAVAVAIVALPSGEHATSTTHVKGAGGLHVFRERDGSAVEATSGDRFRPGEPLRFSVDLEAPAWVALVGVESTGSLYAVYPRENAAIRLPAGRNQALPGAMSLDAAAGEDVLHLVVCRSEEPPAACRSSGPGASPACPPGCTTAAFVLRRGP